MIPQNTPSTFLEEIAAVANPRQFSVRRDGPSGVTYRPVQRPIDPRDIASHLASSLSVSIFPLLADQTRMAVLDFDAHGVEIDLDLPRKPVRGVKSELEKRGIRYRAFRSGGGVGTHIWVFFENPQPAALVRQLLIDVLSSVGLKPGAQGVVASQVEVFPKQDVDPGKGGSCISLPLSRNSAPWNDDLSDVVPLSEWSPPSLADCMNGDIDPTSLPPAKPRKPRRSRGDEPPLAAIKPILDAIPADDYDVWIKVGMVLYHVYGGDGYEAWLEWSQGSASFGGERACEARWRSFGAREGVGIGTLFYLAREHGWTPGAEPEALAEVNARYIILGSGKRPSVIDEHPRDPDGLSILDFIGPETVRARLRAYPYTAGGRNEPQDLGDEWLKSAASRRVERVIFDPAKEPGIHGASYNMWRGFGVEAVAGDWSMFRTFVKDIIANGDAQIAQWIFNWLAWVVQRRSEPIGTAPVLRGLPGVGKGFFVTTFGRLWRPHFVTVTSPEHVLGHFNAFMMGRRLIFIDEGTFGGDRRRVGTLKTRLTESEIMVEMKGMDPIHMLNRAAFIVASNEESVVPADLNDRRWMMIEVSPKRRQDKAYFAAIAEQMEAGGYEAMLFDLLQRDLSQGPDPTITLPNRALFAQFIPTAEPTLRYLFHMLERGVLPGSMQDDPARTGIANLVEDMRQSEGLSGAADSSMAKKIREVLAPKAEGQTGRFTDRFGYSRRTTMYRFPALDEARRGYQGYVGMDIEWPAGPDNWEPDSPV